METANKYIVVSESGIEVLIMFEQLLKHSEIAAFYENRGLVKSAGFVEIATGACYGESISLGIKSRPEADTKLAKRLLGL